MECEMTEAAAENDQLGYSLRNDIIFKYVFGHEKSEKILRALLNAILGLNRDNRIVRLSFLSPVNLKEYLNDKFTTLDVKAKDSSGKRYNVEMQVKAESFYISRAIYYHDKLFSGQLKEHEPFKNLRRTLSISILNHILLEQESDLHNTYRYANIKSGRELTDIKELHFIELPKFRKDKPRLLMTRFEKWLYVLKYGEHYAENPDLLPDTLKTEEEIVMAIKRMQEASQDDLVRELMEHRQKALHDEATRMYVARKKARTEGRAEGRAEGLKNGIEIGKNQEQQESALAHAKKMKAHGIAPEIIKEVTGIDVDSLE
ncbi:MAG: Rpn family recombination-promoting nuclease/putative transposase [Vulcanimicrobiota bacterium]